MWKLLGYAFLLAVVAVASAPAQAQVTGTNWTATFYNNTTLSGSSVATQSYPDGIFFNWEDGPPLQADNMIPVPNVGSDNFSVRFTSTQTFAQAGTYVFTIYVDDGMRVFFNDLPVIDQFNENTTPDYRTFSFERAISASEQIAMRVEYVEFTGNARFTFQWGIRTAPPFILIDTPYDGETVMGDHGPNFVWQDVGAPSYVFRLWSDGGRLLLKTVNDASAICNGAQCTFNSSASIMLENDEYAWQVKTKNAPEKRKSGVIEFAIEYPGKPLNLSPDFDTVVTGSAPILTWSDVVAANQYKVVLTRLNNGAKIKLGWQPDTAFGCDGNLCTLDPAAMQPPLAIPRGKYKWRVTARDIALKTSVSKSTAATFEFTPTGRMSLPPPPEAADGFRAP